MTETPLFLPHVTHIEVRCWQCKHQAKFTREDLPTGLTIAGITEKARCKECGAGWPEVIQHPKPKSRW